MKRIIGLIIAGAVIPAIGLALEGSLQPGNGAVVAATEEPFVDGQVGPVPVAMPDPVASGAPLAGATYYRTYGGYEFRPVDSGLTFAPLGAGMYAVAIPSGGPSFKRGLDLPNGVLVNRIDFYVVDNSPDYDMLLQFYRVEPSVSTGQTDLGHVTTSGSSPSVQTVSIIGAPITTIDYSRYAYCLRYGPVITGDLHMLVGAQVQYSYPPAAYLPLIEK